MVVGVEVIGLAGEKLPIPTEWRVESNTNTVRMLASTWRTFMQAFRRRGIHVACLRLIDESEFQLRPSAYGGLWMASRSYDRQQGDIRRMLFVTVVYRVKLSWLLGSGEVLLRIGDGSGS